jgi:hypothetical protein
LRREMSKRRCDAGFACPALAAENDELLHAITFV